MKNFKKVIAIILCIAAIIGGFTLIVSAKEEIGGEGWVELVCDTDQKVTFSVPYKLISSGRLFSEPHYLVKTDGKRIEDCFEVAPSVKDDTYYTMGGFEYLGFCIYDTDDDCYYAQFKIIEPDLKQAYQNYGFSAFFEALVFYPFAKIGKAMDLKLCYKSYGYAEEHYSCLSQGAIA